MRRRSKHHRTQAERGLAASRHRRWVLWLVVWLVAGVIGGRWLHLERVAAQSPEPEARPSPSKASPSLFAVSDCVRFGIPTKRDRTAERVRVGTWNLRWFPHGGPGSRPRTGEGPVATNIDRLACEIAALGVDALALQEIKGGDESRGALERLTHELDSLTHGAWRVELDHCAGNGRQHVAILWDAGRLRATEPRDVAILNPRGTGACDGNLRPGLSLYFTRPGGLDFHFVAVHLKSGPQRTDLEDRAESMRAMGGIHEIAQRIETDGDVVIAGDFNTMGCARCKPKVSSVDEHSWLDALLGGLEPPMRRVLPSHPCSEYYRGRGTLLDHILVSSAMKEAEPAARVEVHGFCAELACARVTDKGVPDEYRELSDHCPLVLELDARDLD
jgi:endonuclease/exonuclease/phosphatase family metal-dependent hydrolase